MTGPVHIKDVRSRVRVGEEFDVGVGVHQGSVFSPLLLIIHSLTQQGCHGQGKKSGILNFF